MIPNHPTLKTLLTAAILAAIFSSNSFAQRRPPNAVIIAVTTETKLPRGRSTLRLDVHADALDMVNTNRTGGEIRTSLGRPDGLSLTRAAALARTVSPYRLGATHDVVEPMVTDFDLGALLGIGDIGALDVHSEH